MSVTAIAGVSSTAEAIVMTVFPSVAGSSIGRVLGRLYNCLPVRILGVGPNLSTLLFALPTAPIGALLFMVGKIGTRYVLTNRAVQMRSSAGSRLDSSAVLTEIDQVECVVRPGQEFFQAADIRLIAANGKTLLTLGGVKDPEAFANAILRARDARTMTQAALDQINARAV